MYNYNTQWIIHNDLPFVELSAPINQYKNKLCSQTLEHCYHTVTGCCKLSNKECILSRTMCMTDIVKGS